MSKFTLRVRARGAVHGESLQRVARGEPTDRTAISMEETIRREYERWMAPEDSGPAETPRRKIFHEADAEPRPPAVQRPWAQSNDARTGQWSEAPSWITWAFVGASSGEQKT